MEQNLRKDLLKGNETVMFRLYKDKYKVLDDFYMLPSVWFFVMQFGNIRVCLETIN